MFDKLNYSCPIAKSHSQVKSEVLPINVLVDLLSLIISFEVSSYLSFLLVLLIVLLKSVNELHAIVVLILDEGSLSYREVKFVQSGLGDQFPKSLMRVLLDKLDCIF